MDFVCTFRGAPGASVVQVAGEIDLATAGTFHAVALSAMEEHGPCLLVDLSGVTFMDARGLTVLLQLRRAATESGGFLRLDNVPCQVRRILEITRLDELLASADQPRSIDLRRPSVPRARGRRAPA